MTPERAREIVKAINNRCLYTMDLADRPSSLSGVTLAQMVEAREVVEQHNEAKENVGGSYSISMVPDDRLIAAAYCIDHYPVSREAILVLPMTRGEQFEFDAERKALAVVPIKAESDSDDED